jgi:hypothetical protein
MSARYRAGMAGSGRLGSLGGSRWAGRVLFLDDAGRGCTRGLRGEHGRSQRRRSGGRGRWCSQLGTHGGDEGQPGLGPTRESFLLFTRRAYFLHRAAKKFSALRPPTQPPFSSSPLSRVYLAFERAPLAGAQPGSCEGFRKVARELLPGALAEPDVQLSRIRLRAERVCVGSGEGGAANPAQPLVARYARQPPSSVMSRARSVASDSHRKPLTQSPLSSSTLPMQRGCDTCATNWPKAAGSSE